MVGNVSTLLLFQRAHTFAVSGSTLPHALSRYLLLSLGYTWVVEGPEASDCLVRIGVGNELLHLLQVNGVD